MKRIRKHFIALILIVFLAIFTFWKLPDTFFQQDEWEMLAVTIYSQSKGFMGLVESFLPIDSLSHFNPLSVAHSLLEYRFFHVNFVPYAWQSIFLHIVNTLLFYSFVYMWLRNRNVAFFASLFFGVNSIPHQAVTWVAAAVSYEVPMTLILLSLIFFNWFISQKSNRKRNLMLSLSMLFISLLFHENGVFLYFFYPLVILSFVKSERKRLFFMFSYGTLISVFVFAMIRTPFFFGLTSYAPKTADFSHPPVFVYPYRLFSMSMKSLAGSLIPEKMLIKISEQVVRLAYPQFLGPDTAPNPYITQSVVFDFVSYMITVFLFCIFGFFIKKTQEKRISSAFLWALMFVPASLSPYIFVLGKAGYASIIESKFFYIGNIGVSILVGIITYSLLRKFSKKIALQVVVCVLFGLYVLGHVYAIQLHLSNLEKISNQRKIFLTAIRSSYANLPQRVVFYTKSDSAYYGKPENEKMLPVQIGFGRMLMVWYQQTEHFPGCLFENRFLLAPLEEGFRSCGGRGFGYYRHYERFVAALLEHRIPPEAVIAYSWNSKRAEFTNITTEIRAKLAKDIPYEPQK